MFLDSLHEECGVFGIYDRDGFDCARMCYYGLYALQHRGQESCGIAINCDREISMYKGMGLVNEVFGDKELDNLKGHMAVSHVRYSTAGGSMPENAQPLVTRYVKGVLAIAHNGNLSNGQELRRELEQQGAIFQTTTDSEIIAYIVARERTKCHSVEEAVSRAMGYFKGAYSLLVMSPRKLIAARDPHGFRPLAMGRMGDGTVCFASETCALDAVGATLDREVRPGEIIVIDNDGLRTMEDHLSDTSNTCIFEYIYFARTDSVIEGQSVYHSRFRTGEILAKEYPIEADIVAGVPDSGLAAAMGYAAASGIPYGDVLVKNRYIGRTFIQPKQSQRETAVRIKLNALESNVKGKRVVLLDDSIVRGTTSAHLIEMLRSAGAKEVHMLICSPPFKWPCFFGTDIPSRKDLIANKCTVEEIRQKLGADTLGYLSLEGLKGIAPYAKCGFCTACFTGDYPDEVPPVE